MRLFDLFKTKSKEKTDEQRKVHTVDILRSQNIPYIDWLPVFASKNDCKYRTAEEIIKRAISSLISAQMALEIYENNYDRDVVNTTYMNVLKAFEISVLTNNETKVFNLEVDEQEIINLIWKLEGYRVLLWVLGFANLDYPDKKISTEIAISPILKYSDLSGFLENAKLRDMEEILDMANLVYHYDWACVDARINGKPAPPKLDQRIVKERHAAFSWLLYDDDWDNPELNT